MMKHEELLKVHGKIQDHFKKYADKVVVPMYTPKLHSDNRKEGERWRDPDGKEWEMKNGIPQSISKLQDAKTPWWCPVCTLPLNSDLHLKMWRKKGKCHRCVVEEETKMRMEGTWKDYEDKNLLLNKISWYRDRVIELAYYLETLHAPEFQIWNEELGTMVMVEKWTIPLEQLREDVGTELVTSNTILTEMEELYREKFGPLPGEEPNE